MEGAMERTQFTCYESFYKAIARMRRKADQADTFLAIARLALYGEMPNLEECSEATASALELMIPNILSSIRKAENGKQGGSKSPTTAKQTASKREANEKQTANKIEIEKEIEIDSKERNIKKESKQAKHKHGRYENVLLTDEELETLKGEFSDWEQRIERLSEYIASTGKSYKSHLATIRAWARKDGVTAPKETARPAPTADATAEIRRLLETM